MFIRHSTIFLHDEISLEVGTICRMVPSYEPGKAGKGWLMYYDSFRVILPSTSKNITKNIRNQCKVRLFSFKF